MRKIALELKFYCIMLAMLAISMPGFAGAPISPERRASRAPVGDQPLSEIITQVSGQRKYFDKHAAGLYQYWWWYNDYEGQYPAEIVWGDDGYIYIKDLISEGVTDSYVKGSLEGDRIVVPVNQTVWYGQQEGYGLNLGVFSVDTSSENYVFTLDETIQNVTYKIQPDGKIVLADMPEGVNPDGKPTYWVGYYFTDDMQFGGYAEYIQEFNPEDRVAVAIPEGAQIERYLMSDGIHGKLVDVAFHEGNLYIRGLYSAMPDATVMARVSGDRAYLPQNEFLGINVEYIYTKIVTPDPDDEDEYLLADGEMEYVFNIDSEKGVIKSDMEGYCLCFNASLDESWPVAVFPEIILSKNLEDSGNPQAPMGLEYDNYFEDMGAGEFMFYLSNLSDTGALLDADNLYFRILLDNRPLVFQEAEHDDFGVIYYGIENPTEYLPYGFTNEYDITIGDYKPDQYDVLLYNLHFTEVGVQLVYYRDGVKLYGDIAVYNKKTGATSVVPGSTLDVLQIEDNDPGKAAYYTVDGVKVERPGKGIYILRQGNTARKVIVTQ